MLTICSESDFALNMLHLVQMIHPKSINHSEHDNSFKLAHVISKYLLLLVITAVGDIHKAFLDVLFGYRLKLVRLNNKFAESV